jgi:hypothetical protein
LQIFTPESVLVLKVTALDAELNSALNGDIFKGIGPKYWFLIL